MTAEGYLDDLIEYWTTDDPAALRRFSVRVESTSTTGLVGWAFGNPGKSLLTLALIIAVQPRIFRSLLRANQTTEEKAR